MKEVNEEIESNKEEIIKIILNVLEKGANYSIKSMSVGEHLKELLLDVKNTILNSNFKQILKLAIDGAVKEGKSLEENRDVDEKNIESMIGIAFEGGLAQLINLGLEIVTSSKRVGNIFSNYIDEFLNKLKKFSLSKEFKNKLFTGIEKSLNRVKKFKKLCTLWYNAYDKVDIDDVMNIAEKLNGMKGKIKFDNECLNENEVIQNVTEIVSKKKDKISRSRLDIYENLQEI